MLKFAMIGAGIISREHAQALRLDDRATLSAVVDLDETRVGQVAAPFGAAVYTDWRRMLCEETIDAAIINLPHFLHVSCAQDCARAGVHMLVEKPMANNARECEEMIEAANRTGVVLQIAHVQRYFPQNRAARQIVASGELGTLMMIHDLRTSNYFLPQRPKWFLRKAQAGGGILMNFGAHSLDKIMYLTGSRLARVTGKAGYANPDADVDGNAQLFLTTESGVSATVTLCGYAVEPINETMLYFSRGALRLRTADILYRTDGQGGGWQTVDTSGYEAPFSAQLSDFITAIETGKPPVTDGRWGLEIVQAIGGIYQGGGQGGACP